jgi:DNA replication protein DnaC
MSETPQVLLQHHLKKLRLPTFNSEYAKLARPGGGRRQNTNLRASARGVRPKARITRNICCDSASSNCPAAGAANHSLRAFARGRERRMIERRIKAAKFPATKSLDSFDFKAIPSLNKALTMELARCEFALRRENVIALGPSGTGKTHIALGLGLAACQKGLKVRFTTAAALVHELVEAVDERRLQRLQKTLASQDLLIIDELGFVPLSKTGAELLFEIISQRYERGSIIITSNLPFDEWTEVFGSERLTGAILDRLTHHVHILEMNGESFRLRQSRKTKA